MTVYIAACEQVTAPPVLITGQGKGSLDCSGGVVKTVAYSPVDSALGQLLELTPDQALAISSAIALLWAIAWGFKQVVRFLKEPENEIE